MPSTLVHKNHFDIFNNLCLELLVHKPCYLIVFKGTLSVISSDFPCKDDNARFTTIP